MTPFIHNKVIVPIEVKKFRPPDPPAPPTAPDPPVEPEVRQDKCVTLNLEPVDFTPIYFPHSDEGNQISVMVTTFLRDGSLFHTLKNLAEHCAGVKIIVVDDGYSSTQKQLVYRALKEGGHTVIELPFDSGLCAKRNAAVRACTTDFILLGSDDFLFDAAAYLGVHKLHHVLYNHPEIAVAAGRVKDQPYEGFLTRVPGHYIKETRLIPSGTREFYPCELTVNYFLARVSLIRDLPWDERMKIGGEHGDWFMDLKNHARQVVWVPGVSVREVWYHVKGNHPDYVTYRARAFKQGHQIFLQKQKVPVHIGFDSIPPSAYPAVLIAVKTCAKNNDRRDKIRATWAKDCEDVVDFKFFRAGNPKEGNADTLVVDAPDDYIGLSLKVQAICCWALERGYDYMFLVDDDSKVNVKRLMANVPVGQDYVGRRNACFGGYCSLGPGAWLSAKAMKIIAEARWNQDPADDRWIGMLLQSKGIKLVDSSLYVLDIQGFDSNMVVSVCAVRDAPYQKPFPPPPPLI